MFSHSISAFLKLALVLGGVQLSAAAPLEPRAACTTYQIISSRGTFVPQNQTWGYSGMISQTLAAVPGGSTFDTVYPASVNIPASPNQGVVALSAYLVSQNQACPKQKFVLLGYSQGAEVTERSIQDILPSGSKLAIYKAIKAIVLIGNPGHKPNSPANVDQNGGNTTTQWTGAGPDGKPVVGTPAAYISAKKFLDICWDKDHVCAADEPGSNLVAHLNYITSAGVQKLGSNFIISKLKA